jgi:DNA-binding GntR family transcriptional regulator
MTIYAEHKGIVDTFRRGDKEAAVKILEEGIS